MLQTAPIGRSLPLPPVMSPLVEERRADDDLAAASCATPRPPREVARLARRIVSGSVLAKHWIMWACVSLALWTLGTATAIAVDGGAALVLALGLGGLAGGVVAGALWYGKRYMAARTLAREGQLVVGIATYRRSRETLGGELGEMVDALLGQTSHSVLFSIGFIRHEVRGAFDSHDEGETCCVLVRPGTRDALAFDRHGHAQVGELLRIG